MNVMIIACIGHWNMTKAKSTFQQTNIMKRSIKKIGFWSAILAFTSTVAYCIVQILQLYDLVFYPMDEILIYTTSLCIVIPFLLAILALHYTTPDGKKFWSHASLIFTILYAVFVTANYVVQLATVIPMSLKGNLDEVRILQQLPHSLFWNFDALGYIFMGLAAGVAVPIFSRKGIEGWVRLSFIAHAFVTPLISIVYFYPFYSFKLLLLGLPWAVTAPAFMFMIALYFRQSPKNKCVQKPVSLQASTLELNN
jgi:hypothetical protein